MSEGGGSLAPLMKRVLFHSGLLALARLARQRVRGVVLRYHALTEGRDEVLYAAPDICLPVDVFRLQMAFVQRAYRVVSLDELVHALERGAQLPPRALVITFDDGYADNHRLGLPVLRALGLPATIYVATGAVDGGAPFWVAAARALALRAPGDVLEVPGQPAIPLGPPERREVAAKTLTRALVPLRSDARATFLSEGTLNSGLDLDRMLAGTMLTWNQIRELHAAGWTIGAHTVTHANVALAAPEHAEADIVGSRDALSAVLGTVTCRRGSSRSCSVITSARRPRRAPARSVRTPTASSCPGSG